MMEDKRKDYHFVVHQYILDEVVGDKSYKQEVVGLGLYDTIKDLIYPLPLTKFIEQFRNGSASLSSQKNPAESIKRFLNYCRENALENDTEFIDIRERGIKGLRLNHGSHYITSLSLRCRFEGLDPSYARQDIRYLNKFYYFLQSEGVIEKQFEPLYKERLIKKSGGRKNEKIKIYSEIDIFKKDGLDTVYPPHSGKKKEMSKLKDFGKDRYLLVKEFIDTAEAVESDIVIGLYFQFFGGVRRGETVNLTRDALLQTEDGYILDVDDRRELLFPDKKNTDLEQVKVPRYQGLLWHNQMDYAIRKHLEWLDTLRKQNKLIIPQALLINKRTMKPITGANYWEKFNRVKEVFLQKLSENGRIDHFIFLNSKEWSTHIGRGCFTNFCLDIGMNIGEVAVARGDSNPNSVMDYLEKKVAVQTLRDAMNHITKAFEIVQSAQDGKYKVNSIIEGNYIEKWGSKCEF